MPDMGVGLIQPVVDRSEIEWLQVGKLVYDRKEHPEDPDWAANDKLQQVAAVHSFAAFVNYMWPIIHGSRPFLRGPHVDIICYALEQFVYGNVEGNELVINIPPGTLKSVIVNIMLPSWIWLHRPDLWVMGISGSENVIERDNRRMREIINSPRYKRLIKTAMEVLNPYGMGPTLEKTRSLPGMKDAQVWTISKDQKRKERFANTEGGLRFSLASGADITGERADLQIIDDPVDAKDATEGSPEVIAEKMALSVHRYTQVWSTRLMEPANSLRVTIMQRLHENDLAGHLLRKGVPHVVLPMEFDPDHPYLCPLDWRTEPGELLIPSLYPRAVVERLKEDLQEYGAAAQFQQLPSPKGGGAFKDDAWSYYSGPPTDMARQIIEKGGVIWGSLDTASKSNFDSAWTAIVIVGFLGPACYILDVYLDRVAFPGLLKMFETAKTEWGWGVSKWLIEDASSGIQLIQMHEGDRSIEGVTPHAHGGKEDRAGSSQLYQNRGNMHLPRDKAWTPYVVKEHSLFPAGTRRDVVDAVSQACVKRVIEDSKRTPQRTTSDKLSFLASLAKNASDPLSRALSRLGR